MKLLPLLLVLCLALCGCATTPVKLADSHPVDPSRHYADFAMYARPAPHGTKVVIVRDEGFLGSGATVKLYVDGHLVTRFRPGDRDEFFVKAGDHILATEPAPNIIGGIVEHSFPFHPDQTAYFRVTVGNPNFDIQPTTQIQ